MLNRREYRIYTFVSGTNLVKGVPAILVCKNDTEAVKQAEKLLNGLDIEVWEGTRKVTRIKSPNGLHPVWLTPA